MPFYTLDPLREPRWDEMVASHPRSSVFHQVGWLRALAKTYGYRPIAVTTSSSQDIAFHNGVVFCEVRSWITGKRLVSLPFSDHLDPLLNEMGDQLELVRWIQSSIEHKGYKYVELRPLTFEFNPRSALVSTESFWIHTIDLRHPLDRLFNNMHRDCIQRRIRHCERQGLTFERGTADSLIRDFHWLLVATRRRHGVLPQPLQWFLNLISETSLNAEIRMLRKDGEPAAALFTIRHRRTVVYKYGCSDKKFHHLGAMPHLFWKLIEESHADGADQIDLGRTAECDIGLAEFKNRLGASCRRIFYVRHSAEFKTNWTEAPHLVQMRRLAASVPNPVLAEIGRIAYRHFG